MRPAFVFTVFTPTVYVSFLWRKAGIDPLRYVCVRMEEDKAIFVFWAMVWVVVQCLWALIQQFGNTMILDIT